MVMLVTGNAAVRAECVSQDDRSSEQGIRVEQLCEIKPSIGIDERGGR